MANPAESNEEQPEEVKDPEVQQESVETPEPKEQKTPNTSSGSFRCSL